MKKRRHMKRKTGFKLLLFLFIFCLAAVGIIMIFAGPKLDVDIKQNVEVNENDELYYNDLINSINDVKKNYIQDNSNLYEQLENFAFEKGICSEIVINKTDYFR